METDDEFGYKRLLQHRCFPSSIDVEENKPDISELSFPQSSSKTITIPAR